MQVEAWLQRAASSAPALIALQTPHAQVSYAELERAARAGAAELGERGVRRGGRVAIALAPGIEFAQALHACMLLGAVAVPVDLRLTSEEREPILSGCELVERPLRMPMHTQADAPLPARADMPMHAQADAPTHVQADASAHAQTDIPTHLQVDTSAHTQADAPLHTQTELTANAPSVTHDLDAVCAVIHTSGTTSAPRPVELTYGAFLWSALGSAAALGVDPHERWLCALPLAHVGGLSILMRSAIYVTTAVIHERFDTDSVLAALRHDITLVSLVSTTLARLLDAGLRDPPALRCALTGGGPVAPALVERARAAGVPVVETYGLTECCSQAATAPLGALRRAVRKGKGQGQSQGKSQGQSRGAEASRDVGAGVPLFCTRTEIARDGEILLSGPTVARASAGSDGRLYTGDLGRIDADGFLHVSGRKADTIVSGGENVAPSEVEAVIEACPGVIEAAVVGREDPQWGEAVTAIVVAAPGASVGESVLREHCAARLAPFKVPKRVEVVSGPLPRTRSGKLLRRELQGISI
jgi:O-succinylbenzoic acid--CoA ligase